MDEETLNRMAVEEIIRDINQTKQLELQKTSQKTANTSRTTNKRFLGRTINSILTHNKREDDRKLENCRLKLQELDRLNQRVCKVLPAERKHSRSRSTSRKGSLSLSCSEDSSTAKRRKRQLKKKRKTRKKTNARRSISADRQSTSSELITDTLESTTPPICQSQECEEEALYGQPNSRSEMAYGVNIMLDYYDRINQHYSTLAVCNEMKDLCQSVLTSASFIGNSVQNICTSDTGKKCGNIVSTSPRSVSSLDDDLRSELEISLSPDTESIPKSECSPQRYSDIELLSSSESENNQIDEDVFINVDSESVRDSISDNESSIACISCSSEAEVSCTSKKEYLKSPITSPTNKEDEESNLMIDLTAD